MNDFIKSKQLDRIWRNSTLREAFLKNDGNWDTIEQTKGLKTQILRFTPYIRVQIYTYNKWLNQRTWITLNYFRINEVYKTNYKETDFILENIENTLYNERDLLDYMKQEAFKLKHSRKQLKSSI